MKLKKKWSLLLNTKLPQFDECRLFEQPWKEEDIFNSLPLIGRYPPPRPPVRVCWGKGFFRLQCSNLYRISNKLRSPLRAGQNWFERKQNKVSESNKGSSGHWSEFSINQILFSIAIKHQKSKFQIWNLDSEAKMRTIINNLIRYSKSATGNLFWLAVQLFTESGWVIYNRMLANFKGSFCVFKNLKVWKESYEVCTNIISLQ